MVMVRLFARRGGTLGSVAIPPITTRPTVLLIPVTRQNCDRLVGIMIASRVPFGECQYQVKRFLYTIIFLC